MHEMRFKWKMLHQKVPTIIARKVRKSDSRAQTISKHPWNLDRAGLKSCSRVFALEFWPVSEPGMSSINN